MSIAEHCRLDLGWDFVLKSASARSLRNGNDMTDIDMDERSRQL